jgi:hypothetical protein
VDVASAESPAGWPVWGDSRVVLPCQRMDQAEAELA